MDDVVYRDFILDLYRTPHNKGILNDYDATHREANPSCGDEIAVYVKFSADGAVAAISHDGQGCAISQAAVSLLTDDVMGKTKEEIERMTGDDVVQMLGIPVSANRMGCAMLGLAALKKCLC